MSSFKVISLWEGRMWGEKRNEESAVRRKELVGEEDLEGEQEDVLWVR